MFIYKSSFSLEDLTNKECLWYRSYFLFLLMVKNMHNLKKKQLQMFLFCLAFQ